MASKAEMYKGASETLTQKPTIMGFITTRVLHTEREPLVVSENGMTIGQAVDAQLERLRGPCNGQRPPEGWVAPVIHSVTVELPTE